MVLVSATLDEQNRFFWKAAPAFELQDVPPSLLMANSADFLDMMSRVVVAWIWVRQANTASKALARGSDEAGFYQGKLQAARFYIRRELPRTVQQAELLLALDDTCFAMQDAWF